jgi:hypothetical protein
MLLYPSRPVLDTLDQRNDRIGSQHIAGSRYGEQRKRHRCLGCFVAYDARLLNAARAVGLQVHSPV